MRRRTEFNQNLSKTVAEMRRFYRFLNGGRPPSSICWQRIGTNLDDYFLVSIVAQNLLPKSELFATSGPKLHNLS